MQRLKNLWKAGTRSFHLFNTAFFLLILIQIIMYAVQGASIQCSQMGKLFYFGMGMQIVSIILPVSLFFRQFFNRGHTIIVTLGIIAVLAKIAQILVIVISSQNHVGNCYMPADVRASVALANSAEILCIIVQIIFSRYLNQIIQAMQVQMIIFDTSKQMQSKW